MFPISRALRLFLVVMCTTALVGTACSNDDGDGDDNGDATTTTEATGVTVDTEDEGPPAASVTASAMDLLRQEPQFSSFLSAVEGTRYEEHLECAEAEEALARGWTTVLAPVDGAFTELADGGPSFDGDDGFGEANEAMFGAAGISEGTDVAFDVDGGMGSMTWTVEPGEEGDEADDAPGTPNGTQYVVFAVENGRAVLPTDADTPDLPSVATCGVTSTLQFLVLGATLAEPEDRSAEFPEVVPDDE